MSLCPSEKFPGELRNRKNQDSGNFSFIEKFIWLRAEKVRAMYNEWKTVTICAAFIFIFNFFLFLWKFLFFFNYYFRRKSIQINDS